MKLFASGAVMALLAMSMTASAYHTTGANPTQGLDAVDPTDDINLPFPAQGSAHDWTAQTNVFFPTDEPCNEDDVMIPDPNGDFGGTLEGLWSFILGVLEALPVIGPIFAGLFDDFFTQDRCIFVDPGAREGDNLLAVIAQCETDDQFFGFPHPIAGPGLGGLCTMSPGNVETAGVCGATGGRSNGQGPNYDGVIQATGSNTACEDASSVYGPGLGISAGQDFYGIYAKAAPHDYYKYTMPSCNPVVNIHVGCPVNTAVAARSTFIVQVNGIGCDTGADVAWVDQAYAYATSNGHVFGFVTEDIERGSYTVTAFGATAPTFAADGATACITGTPAPLFWGNPAV